MRSLKTEQDIDSLHGLHEDRTFDIKLDPPQTEKLVEIMQSFANGITDGGHIIIGLGEDDSGRVDRNNKKAVQYPLRPAKMNSSFKNFDEYKRHVLQQFRSSTYGYIEGMVEIYEINTKSGNIIVIEIPQSPNRPHMNTNGRAYIRGDGHTSIMTPHELKSLSSSQNNSEEKEFEDSSCFLQDGEVIATIMPTHNKEEQLEIRWYNGPQVFLRIIPSEHMDFTPFQLKNFMEEFGLRPLAETSQLYYERNKYGAIVFEAKNETRQNHADRITQVFKNGGIWGINGLILNSGDNCIPSIWIEEQLEQALKAYIAFAKEKLQLKPPLTFLAGLKDVNGYRLAVPFDYFYEKVIGNVVEENIIFENTISDYNALPHELLLPFFEHMWEACGVSRPNNFRKNDST